MQAFLERHNDMRSTLDVASVGTLIATLVDMLPAAAALLTFIWTAIRIYETDTVQGWFGKGKKNGAKKRQATKRRNRKVSH
jgi:hypothetical protein